MVDPTALYQGALAVYGQATMDRDYGQLLPVPAHRVLASSDGMVLPWAGRPLVLIDTPGHARHHHCIWDERSRSWFTGDTFGLSYRECDSNRGAWVVASCTPVQFEPEALRQSIARLLAREPEGLYLTHYGRVGDVTGLAAQLLAQIDAIVALGQRLKAAPQRHQALREGLTALYRQQMQAHGSADIETRLAELALDIELNAQGLAAWLDRPAR
jgi:glyoxylase-like metal-dependent hydrolase (beta-lactamase superfamily II)